MANYIYDVRGLKALQDDLKNLTPSIIEAARLAVNKTARDGRSLASAQIRQQVAFPRNYLANKPGTFWVSKTAKGNDLSSVISARERPTSLARFSSGSPTRGRRKTPVRVSIKPGSSVSMPGAFLIKLRAGSADINTRSNLGLAIRTKGTTPNSAYAPKKIGKDLYLLYGPSVSQVFGGSGGVAIAISDELADRLEREFTRLLNRGI